MVTAVVGGNWGDEGKGKMTDSLSENMDFVVRYQGGANAGHTIINEYGKFVLRLLPSGVFHQNIENVIASGVAFDAEEFLDELKMLEVRGVPRPKIRISARTQLLLPLHKLQDAMEEERLAKDKIGSTKSGIAPFYADKYGRKNIQIAELYSDHLPEKVRRIVEDKNIYFKAFYGVENAVTEEELMEYLLPLKEKLKPYLCDVSYYLNNALRDGKRILLEGQLGSLRDVDNGIYPYVTSSSPLAGFGSVSLGIPPHEIKSVVTVVKAYSTCVGAGPFVGELFGKEAEELRSRGGDAGEYGANSGRPRRMGWFDCVATRYGCMVQGATETALTMLDVLGYLEKIPVCVGYRLKGEVLREFPQVYQLDEAEPVYEYLEGWNCDISNVTEYEALPRAAKAYVDFIEKQIQVPVTLVSNGPRRDQILRRKNGNA